MVYIEQYPNISSLEVNQDITDTQREIDNYRDELQVVERNPAENKVQIYMLQGKIHKREEFIEGLIAILAGREEVKP